MYHLINTMQPIHRSSHMLLIHLVIICVLSSGYYDLTDTNLKEHNTDTTSPSKQKDKETEIADNQLVMNNCHNVSICKRPNEFSSKMSLDQQKTFLPLKRTRKENDKMEETVLSTIESHDTEQWSVTADKSVQTNPLRGSVIKHTNEYIFPVNSNSTISNTNRQTTSSHMIISTDNHKTTDSTDVQTTSSHTIVPEGNQNTVSSTDIQTTSSHMFSPTCSNNETGNRGQRSKLSDNIVLRRMIRHVDDEKAYIQKITEQIITLRGMYHCIMSSFWHVFYGYYNDVENNYGRFYIQYDNNGFFMKSNIFEPNNRQLDDIVNFMDYVYNKVGRMSKIPDPTKSNGNRVKKFKTKLPVLRNSDWLLHLLSNYGKYITSEDEKTRWFFNVLSDVSKENIYAVSSNRQRLFCYLINDADIFFRVMIISYMCFRSINNVDINHICQQQLVLFLENDACFKLLVFPDLMALSKCRDRPAIVVLDIKNPKTVYICYYILMKFEKFINYLKKLLIDNMLSIDKLYMASILLCRTYFIELYFTYLYTNYFYIDSFHILGRIYLNRLLVLARSTNYINMIELIELIEYNFIDTFILDQDTFYYSIITIVCKRNIKSITTEKLMYNLYSIFQDNEEQMKNMIEEFINNLQMYSKYIPSICDLQSRIRNDMVSNTYLTIIKDGFIQKWIVDLKNRLEKKIKEQ